MSLFDLGALMKRYRKMVAALSASCMLVGMGYATLCSETQYSAEATLTPVDPTGAVAPITMMATVTPLAEGIIADNESAAAVSISQATVPTTGSQVLTFVAKGQDANECVTAVNDVANATAEAAAAVYGEISETREQDSLNEKNEKIEIIEQLETQDAIARALDTGFRVDRSYAYVSFEVTEAVAATAAPRTGVTKMALTGLLGGVLLSICVIALKNMVKRPIKSRRDVEDVTDVPVLSFSHSACVDDYLWANICFSFGDVPSSVALVPVAGAGSASEAEKLRSAIRKTGLAASAATGLMAAGDAGEERHVQVIACEALESHVDTVRRAREAQAVVMLVRPWEVGVAELLGALRELEIARARVVGIALAG